MAARSIVARRMKLRLQAKYTLAITVLILAVSAIVAFTLDGLFHQTTDTMIEASSNVFDSNAVAEIGEDGNELAAVMSAGLAAPLAATDRAAIESILAAAVQHETTLPYAIAVDRRGEVYRAGTGGIAPVTPSHGFDVTRAGTMVVITAPVEHRGRTVGMLRLGYSMEIPLSRQQELHAALTEVQTNAHDRDRYQFAALLFLLLSGGVVLGGITARRLAKPVRTLARFARTFANGDLTAKVPSTKGDDEIAELARAFEAMRESLSRTTVSRDFLQQIIDSINEGLVVTCPAGEIRLANRAVVEMFGYGAADLHGSPFTMLALQPHQFAAATAETKEVECTFIHHDGHRIPVEVSHSVVSDRDDAEHVYVISNITARKQMEEELGLYRSRLEHLVVERTKELTAVVKELESFSYSVSHDLHAPLRSINGFSAALMEEYYQRLDESGRGYLERIGSATVRMGQLIDGLLSLARVVRSEIRRDRVDLSAIASEIAGDIAASDPRRQATFRIAPHLATHSDAAHMRLLLQNLFGNAWKFTRFRKSALIEFGRTEIEGTSAFFVRDNGAGFDPLFSQGLFKPFHRLHDKDEFPGTGIGLATVQRIIARHGGEVWAEANPGTGATFFFTLPACGENQVEESRVSSLTPLSKSVSSQRPSATAWRRM